MAAAALPFLKHACPICGAAISVHEKFLPGHCGKPDCALKYALSAEAERQAEKKAYYAESCRIATEERADDIQHLAQDLDLTPDAVAIGAVPHRATGLAPVPEDYRAAYLAHLVKITDAAFAEEDPKPADARDIASESAEPFPWNTTACTACEGSCCSKGGGEVFAFQTTDLILHLRQTRPELTREEVLQHYSDALPEQSVEGACIFQGPRGCQLSRDWRADICNTFRCYELRQLARQFDPEKHRAIAMFSMYGRKSHRMTSYAMNDTSGEDGR